VEDLRFLTVGEVNSIMIESMNDSAKYDYLATQADMDAL
jgi:hypothetical protein